MKKNICDVKELVDPYINLFAPWLRYGLRIQSTWKVFWISLISMFALHVILNLIRTLFPSSLIEFWKTPILQDHIDVFFVFVYISLELAFFHYFLRRTLSDLAKMKSLYGTIYRPSKHSLFSTMIEFFAALTLGFVSFVVFTTNVRQITTSKALSILFSSSTYLQPLNPFFVGDIAIIISGIFVFSCFVSLIRLSLVMNKGARLVEIDLLALHELSVFSNPFSRVLIISIVMFSISASFIAFDETRDVAFNFTVPLSILGAILSIIPWIIGPLILQRRVIRVKNLELERLYKVLKGDNKVLAETRLGVLMKTQPHVDVLQYHEIVLEMWTFPAEAQTRRILLVTTIPPITWVLSAIVQKIIT